MIKQLIKLANHLDAKGLSKEADYLDAVMRKYGGERPRYVNEKIPIKDVNLDTMLWRIVLDNKGYPVAAIYFNGRRFSLAQEDMEELQNLIWNWADSRWGDEEDDSSATPDTTQQPIQQGLLGQISEDGVIDSDELGTIVKSLESGDQTND